MGSLAPPGGCGSGSGHAAARRVCAVLGAGPRHADAEAGKAAPRPGFHVTFIHVHLTTGKSPIIGDFTDTATERDAVSGPVNGVFRFKIQKYKSQFFFKKTVTATVKR